jgi:hypothetical protein
MHDFVQAANRVRQGVKYIVVKSQKLSKSEEEFFKNEWNTLMSGLNFFKDWEKCRINDYYYEVYNPVSKAKQKIARDFVHIAGLKDTYSIQQTHYSLSSYHEDVVRYGKYTIWKVVSFLRGLFFNDCYKGKRSFEDFEFVLGNVRFRYDDFCQWIELVDYRSDFELLEAIQNETVPNNMKLREYRIPLLCLLRFLYGVDSEGNEKLTVDNLARFEIFGYTKDAEGQWIEPELFNFDTSNKWVLRSVEKDTAVPDFLVDDEGETELRKSYYLEYMEKREETIYECPDLTGTKTEVATYYSLTLTDKYLNRKLNRLGCRCRKEQKMK